jgi:hypothetical protein
VANFHAWHPAFILSEPLTVECFLTLGDSLFMGRGTDALVRSTLDAVGTNLDPVAWSCDAVRTHYFSSYREDSSDWRDRWALAWRLRVEVRIEPRPTLEAIAPGEYLDVDAVDRSFTPATAPDAWNEWPAVILADGTNAVVSEATRIATAFCENAHCVIGRAYTRWPQLRCDLGPVGRQVFESGAPTLERLVTALAERGLSVRFDGFDRLLHAPADA